jgi:predicted metalloprotease
MRYAAVVARRISALTANAGMSAESILFVKPKIAKTHASLKRMHRLAVVASSLRVKLSAAKIVRAKVKPAKTHAKLKRIS